MSAFVFCCFVYVAIITGAGKGELAVSIKSSKNETVPFEKKPSASGYQIKYTPLLSGTYTIFMTFGGVDVPGEIFTDCTCSAVDDHVT
jgi:hypothetical protein